MNEDASHRASGAAAPGSISVCIAIYNAAGLVERAVRSVESQTLPALEVVAVDDGSTDETPQVLERLRLEGRLTVVRQANAGISQARNEAIRRARGEWIVPLDADDELDPRALERARAAVDRTPGAHWCITDIVRVGGDGEEVFATAVPPGPTAGWLVPMLERNFVERTILLRREMMLEIGGYDETFRCFEDWELNIRMLRTGVIAAYAPGPLYRYIKTPGGLTSDVPRILQAYRQLYERHHRPLADSGNPACRSIYARRMWALGREYLDRLRDPRAALGCMLTSLRYEFDPVKLLRAGRGRLIGRVSGGRRPTSEERSDDPGPPPRRESP